MESHSKQTAALPRNDGLHADAFNAAFIQQLWCVKQPLENLGKEPPETLKHSAMGCFPREQLTRCMEATPWKKAPFQDRSGGRTDVKTIGVGRPPPPELISPSRPVQCPAADPSPNPRRCSHNTIEMKGRDHGMRRPIRPAKHSLARSRIQRMWRMRPKLQGFMAERPTCFCKALIRMRNGSFPSASDTRNSKVLKHSSDSGWLEMVLPCSNSLTLKGRTQPCLEVTIPDLDP